MKLIFKYLACVCVLATLTFSCKKDGSTIYATQGTSGTLTSTTSTPELIKANAADTVITFNWNMADFGYEAGITQTMQFAVSGTNFADSIVVTLNANQVRQAFTENDLNTIMTKLNLSFTTASKVDVRIKSTISTAVTAVYSNSVPLTVLPYAATSWLYVPGAYEGWDLTAADSLISATGNNVYVGIINFPSASSEFKLTPAKSWTTAYGSGGVGILSTDGGAGNLASPSTGTYPGSYQITANLNASTYSMTYLQWSVIGDATLGGWNTDTDLKYNNGDSTWSVTTTLAAGGLKFRKNHDWGTNYGGSGLSGTPASGGDNIAITTAGSYLIKLDIPNSKYTITKK